MHMLDFVTLPQNARESEKYEREQMGKAKLIVEIMNTVNKWPHDKQVKFLNYLKCCKNEQEATVTQ